MAMKIQFETPQERAQGLEMPILVDVDKLSTSGLIRAMLIDGEEAGLDETIIETFRDVVVRMRDEKLPDGHFRDCVHFVIAMNGIWLPTHRPFDRGTEMRYVCDESLLVDPPEGPVFMGVPNDERCLGFGDANFVYFHSAIGYTTLSGVMYLQRLGVDPVFGLSTLEQALAYSDTLVAHPMLSIEFDGTDIQWRSSK